MTIEVSLGDEAEGAGAVREKLVAEGVPAALAAKDPTLWGPDAEGEAAIRLGWLDLPLMSRELLPEIGNLVEMAQAEGLDHVVLAGMGG
jgi:glucose-6-phosphate isomerase